MPLTTCVALYRAVTFAAVPLVVPFSTGLSPERRHSGVFHGLLQCDHGNTLVKEANR